jgi:hypothetical protein
MDNAYVSAENGYFWRLLSGLGYVFEFGLGVLKPGWRVVFDSLS